MPTLRVKELLNASYTVPFGGKVAIYPSVELYKLLDGKRIQLTYAKPFDAMRDGRPTDLALVAELVDED